MKEVKTNAMRFLDKKKIAYEVIQYECDEFVDGIAVADKCGIPYEQSFKTLVTEGKRKNYFVFVIPIAMSLDLKKAAKSVGEKSVEMVHVKDILGITGYIRGGCSPLGMKKQFKTVIDSSAEAFESIVISGGRIGSSIRINPRQLAEIIRGDFADICRDET